jgi:large subunit ribosomal protein L5
LLKRLVEAKDHILTESQFDESGNIAFGIHEYIDIPQVAYDPKIGIMGLQVCITLERPGFRIKRRSLHKAKISDKHSIKKEDAMEFMKKEFAVKIGE